MMIRAAIIFTLILMYFRWSCAAPATTAQQVYQTPDDAVRALVDAVDRGDNARLKAILGPGADAVLKSGDPVADKKRRADFVRIVGQRCDLVKVSATRQMLQLGDEKWPFPIPLVKRASGWAYDTATGKQEILNRRIGLNELKAIDFCHIFVDAERDYAAHDGKGAFAGTFFSSKDKHDGLYWATGKGQIASPLGPTVAAATTEGYVAEGKGNPFHGYRLRILTSQGSDAPGGARPYLVDGRMTGGFALVMWPATWRNSGVMTFIVNQDGIVYQKDLGAATAATAASMSSFNPDGTWTTVKTR